MEVEAWLVGFLISFFPRLLTSKVLKVEVEAWLGRNATIREEGTSKTWGCVHFSKRQHGPSHRE